MSDQETPPASQAENQPTSKTPEEALDFIATRADRMEQMARNIRQAIKDNIITPPSVMNACGVTIEKNGDTRHYYIKHGGQYTVARDENGRDVYAQNEVELSARRQAISWMQEYADILDDAGRLAHKVNLDKSHLTRQEENTLAHLPRTIADVGHILEHITNQDKLRTTEQVSELAVQLRRDAKELKRYGEEIGNSTDVLLDYSRQHTDRQSDLETCCDITQDRNQRFLKGAELLGKSDEFANKRDPSYRSRTEMRRKPENQLPIISYTDAEDERRKMAAQQKDELTPS